MTSSQYLFELFFYFVDNLYPYWRTLKKETAHPVLFLFCFYSINLLFHAFQEQFNVLLPLHFL